MYTLALVEDDCHTRELLTRSVRKCAALKLIGTYPTARKALLGLPSLKPDVVLMDIKLPGMDGIECVQHLRGLRPSFKSRILMLTEHAESDRIFEALKAGADGYLLKRNASSQELQGAVEEVWRGGAPMSPSVAKKVIDYFKTLRPQPPDNTSENLNRFDQLSIRQQEVLHLLSVGLMYKEIADHLNVSINGVRKHLQSIYKKLHVRSRADATWHCLIREHRDGPRHYTKM
jgi:DNA-binding NarL/FixJ family response regulator